MVELKNTLSGLFFFAAILAYLNFDHTRRPTNVSIGWALIHTRILAKQLLRPFPQSCSS